MKKILTVSAIAILGFTSVAFAGGLPEEMPAAPTPVSASDAGIYVGISGGFGLTNWKYSWIANQTNASISNDNGPVGRIFLGFDFNRYFGVEAGYTYFFNRPKFTLNTLFNRVKSTQDIDFMFKGKLPVAENFDLFAKLGVNYLMSSFDNSNDLVNNTMNTSRNSFNVAFGAGADYYITPNVIANVEWLRFNGDSKCDPNNTSTYQPNADIFVIGLRYKFDI